MKYLDFNPFSTSAVRVEFNCPDCGTLVDSEEISVPSINYAAETAGDSEDYNDGYATCNGCERQFDIDVMAGYGGGYITINDLPEDYRVKLIETDYEELEAILSNTEFYDTFQSEILKIKDLNDAPIEEENGKEEDWLVASHGMLLTTELVETLRKLLFTNAITCLESYLSSAFMVTVISKPEYLKKFFETFEDFQKEKITVSKLFELKDKTEDIAKQAMSGVVYHNFKKTIPMFKNTLGVVFPDFGEIAKAIVVRHDIVHRNGRTKEGNVLSISRAEIHSLLDTIETFVSDIDKQIKTL